MRSDDDQWTITESVGVTALGVASSRAMETRRPDGLVEDPHAEAFLDAVRDELTDRYGEPPTPVHNLLAVARFRQLCRRLGVTEVAVAGSQIRIGPVTLPDSAQLRLRRLYPKASYKPAAQVVTVPKPVEGGRIGGAAVRDQALLDWCAELMGQLVGTPAPA